MSFYSNTTGVTYRAGTAHPSGAHEFTTRLWWGVARSLIFCVKKINLEAKYFILLLSAIFLKVIQWDDSFKFI